MLSPTHGEVSLESSAYMRRAVFSCLRLLMQAVRFALSFALVREGRSKAARMAMTATMTRSSMREKAVAGFGPVAIWVCRGLQIGDGITIKSLMAEKNGKEFTQKDAERYKEGGKKAGPLPDRPTTPFEAASSCDTGVSGQTSRRRAEFKAARARRCSQWRSGRLKRNHPSE